MLLDIRTVIAIAAGLGVLIAVSLRYALRDYPALLGASMREWTLGILLQAVSWGLTTLRGGIPDVVSVIAANALLSIGYALLVDAVRRFTGSPRARFVLGLLVGASVCVQLFFTYQMPSTRVRILIGTTLFAALLPYALVPLLRAGPRRRSHWLTATAFAALLAIMLVRVAVESLDTTGLNSAFLSTPLQAFVFGSLALFPVVASFGFLLMCIARLHQELERQASVDALTGLANRRTLGEGAARALAAARRHGRPLALLLIDADHFKRINDAHGHEVGDAALCLLAATIQAALRSEDICGRLGGEEFVALLPDADEAAAGATAERIRRAVEQVEFRAGQEPLPLQVSIGMALLAPQDDFAALLRRADHAMYAAKHSGRNRVVGPSELARRVAAETVAG